jgi:hypothetical protein
MNYDELFYITNLISADSYRVNKLHNNVSSVIKNGEI